MCEVHKPENLATGLSDDYLRRQAEGEAAVDKVLEQLETRIAERRQLHYGGELLRFDQIEPGRQFLYAAGDGFLFIGSKPTFRCVKMLQGMNRRGDGCAIVLDNFRPETNSEKPGSVMTFWCNSNCILVD